MPFWMLICAVLGYLLPESENRELDLDTIDWFPECYWKQLLDILRDSIKVNQSVLDLLIKLYISESNDWIWTGHYIKGQEDVYDFLVTQSSEEDL